MTFRVELAPRAHEQARRIDRWWRENRESSPTLFADELSELLERLEQGIAAGVLYPFTAPFEVRRVLLPRSRYHVYFSIEPDAELVKVRAIWHTARGRGPRLP